MISLLQSDSES